MRMTKTETVINDLDALLTDIRSFTQTEMPELDPADLQVLEAAAQVVDRLYFDLFSKRLALAGLTARREVK